MTAVVEAPALESLPALGAVGRDLLFTNARTANTFSNEPVTDAELTSIWELAKWAPSAMNTQPLRILYVQSEEGRDRLVEHMMDSNKAKTLTAPAVAVLAYDSEFHETIPEVFPVRPEAKDYFLDPAVRDTHGTFNGALQAGYFILSVRAHGLAAGPMGGFDRDGINQEFFGDGRWKSLLVVNIGHPGTDPWFPRLPRLSHDDVVAWA